MTLSRWLRDYVYIPLGGSRCTTTRVSTNLFLTFLVGGIWHGAGWTFIIWGALHGGALVAHRLWQKLGMKMHTALAWFITFMFINAAWVFFRATTVEDALRVLKGMAGQNGIHVSNNFLEAINALYGLPKDLFASSDIKFSTDLVTFQCILFFGLISFLAPNTMQMTNHGLVYDRRFLYKRNASTAFIAGCAGGFGALLLFTTTGSEFLYFNF